jgi:hypothetical protein
METPERVAIAVVDKLSLRNAVDGDDDGKSALGGPFWEESS